MVTTARIHASPRRPRRAEGAAAKSKFRPEIQGLRSLAVLMVVSYHIWFGRVSGGVDVFLLISAFLMTLQFTGRFEQQRPMALIRHWLHLFRRLLPAVVVVLTATLLAAYFLMPRSRWVDILNQGWASLFYYQNWVLQKAAVNYYATDHSLASPLQHFWSLSIQGQVFILWPIIFAGAAWLAHRYKLRYRALLTYIFGAIFLVSLTYSIIFTATNQALAYFDTFARLWEFALGTLVALVLPGLYVAKSARVVLGWLGIAAMLSCGILLQVQTAFPGFVALWPTLAAACVIVAGQSGSRLGVDRILSSKFLVRLGDNSYALYLWHWPILVIALAWSGKDHAGWLSGTVIVALSLVLAFLTTKYVEKPLREWKWPEVRRRRAAIAVVACLAAACVPLGGFTGYQQWEKAAAAERAYRDNPGARVFDANYVDQADKSAPLAPSVELAAGDWPVFDGGCKSDDAALTNICSNDKPFASKQILVLGSSHAHVWSTPLLELADKRGWDVQVITKGYCPVTLTKDKKITQECVDFNKETLEKAIAMKPDLVLTTSTRTDADPGTSEFVDASWVSEMKRLNDAGIPVVAIRDTPRMKEPVPDCLASHKDNFSACDANRHAIFADTNPADAIAGQIPATAFLDFTSFFCNDKTCPAVIGNVMVYKDDNHVTRTYMSTLAPYFEQMFLSATGWT